MIGSILYEAYAYFKYMDTVILRKNLTFLKEEDRFLEIQNKYTLIYAVVTMFTAFISGFLFNLNPYIPMIGCLTFCLISIFLSKFSI